MQQEDDNVYSDILQHNVQSRQGIMQQQPVLMIRMFTSLSNMSYAYLSILCMYPSPS